MDELTSVFIQEGREQLQAMEDGLLQLEQQPDNHDNINSIFRAAHTVKGASGVIECHFIEAFTHKAENVLDRLRNGEIQVSSDLTGLLLRCCDHLGRLMDVLEAGQAEPPAEVSAAGNTLLEELSAYMVTPESRAGGMVEAESEVETSGGGVVNTDSWHISVRFGPHMLRGGMDPLSFLRYLTSLGEILALETIPDALPAADEMDPEACYLGFEIRLQTRATKADIERVFDFCRDDCELRILPPNSKLTEYLKLIQELPEDEMRLGEMLVRCGALTQHELDDGLSSQQSGASDEHASPIGEILIEQKVVQKEVVEAAASKQTRVQEKRSKPAPSASRPTNSISSSTWSANWSSPALPPTCWRSAAARASWWSRLPSSPAWSKTSAMPPCNCAWYRSAKPSPASTASYAMCPKSWARKSISSSRAPKPSSTSRWWKRSAIRSCTWCATAWITALKPVTPAKRRASRGAAGWN